MSDENHKTEITRLLTTLEHCRQLAHNGEIEPGAVGKRGVQIHALAAVTELRSSLNAQMDANGHAYAELDFLYGFLENCRRAALGKPIKEIAPDEPWDDPSKIAEITAVLDAVIKLREKFNALEKRWRKATAFHPAPPGPVPSAPPTGEEVLQHIVDKVEFPGTGNPEAMTGPGKPAERKGMKEKK